MALPIGWPASPTAPVPSGVQPIKPDSSPDWTQHSVATPDGLLVYQRSRPGSAGVAVVCCHGFSDNAHTWLPVVDAWVGRYDLIMPDACGHGLSCRLPDEPRLPDADLTDLLTCLDHAEIRAAFFVGHSMGANTVARFAAKYPERTRAVVLEDPPWRRPDETGGSAKNWLSRLQQLNPSNLARLNRINHPKWADAEHDAWISAKLAADPNLLRPLPAGSAPARRLTGPELAAQLAQQQIPGLLLTGDPELGAIVHPDTLRELEPLWPLMRHASFAAAHEIRRDQPAAFVRTVSNFIDEIGHGKTGP